VNFEIDLCFKAGITDPGYSAARDRSRLQQTRLTAWAEEWDEFSASVQIWVWALVAAYPLV
jgi:hypothetical protein